MALSPGARLGPYEILSALGAGGMGEVYRARDGKLNRDVALKILPDLFATDPDRLARFQREAQVLASLNHPNIAAIYGLEESDGVRALVLELVEGPTLADRIAQGRIPLDEALPIARQIADALEAAHEQGIIHRDLKPANIKVRPDGTVKVLDFGLAKLAEPAGSGQPAAGGVPLSMSPTITSPAMMTGIGVILGTAAYMSPEQARGRAADKRSDIWAFGSVLFEMLTAKRAFGGDDVSETLAFVITKEPDWNALPTNTPGAVRRLLRRTLAKDRRERLSDITDARLEINEALSASDVESTSTLKARPHRRERVAWALVAVLFVGFVAALALGASTYFQRAPEDTRTMRFFVSPPDGWSLELGTSSTGAAPAPLAVSPDGHRVALLARNAEGRDRLWVRSLDTLAAQELPGTDGAASPFWAPDSRFLGFFAAGKLKKIDVSGGPPITLCDAAEFRGGTWSRDGVIVFATTAQSALQKVAASGGVPTAATVLGQGEIAHWRPSFLPDGRHFFYRVSNGGIYVASLDSAERTLLIKNPDANNVLYTQGHLLFLRETTLIAQPFDARRLALTGEPVPVAEQIQTISGPAIGVFSASDSGVLTYVTGTAGAVSQLTWLDRMGKPVAAVGDRASYGDLELSPDGKRAAVSVLDPAQRTRDIWLVDLARGLRTRFTFDPAEDQASIWSPDGSRVVFNSFRTGRFDLYQRASSGAGTEDVLLADNVGKAPWSWSPDGRFILYSASGGTTGVDLMVLPLSGDKKPFPFLQTPFNETHGQFSPDGRWIAYDSNDSGSTQVYVAPFPGPGGKAQVSTGGGTWPRWRHDGKEIFYLAADNRLMAAAVNGQSAGFEVGSVRPLFAIHSPVGRSFYDASLDGQRFLVNMLPEQTTAPPITIVVNWMAALKK